MLCVQPFSWPVLLLTLYNAKCAYNFGFRFIDEIMSRFDTHTNAHTHTQTHTHTDTHTHSQTHTRTHTRRSFIYNISWEDPRIDHRLFNITEKDTVLVITSVCHTDTHTHTHTHTETHTDTH